MPQPSVADRTSSRKETGGSSTLLPNAQLILSFDVEEHYRIEAAAGRVIDPALREVYENRVAPSTLWILDELEREGARATFFVVGQIAKTQPQLLRTIVEAGHEVASHGWDHRRVHHFTPKSFREDLRTSCDTLEQVTGQPVLGYRAPTFSIVRQTAWAIDILSELGLVYDSSIYPVRHDRYGIASAPRSPFLAQGRDAAILEIPPATLRIGRVHAPMGGGGYFRLFPLFLTRLALEQIRHECTPPVAMLYFHPWEFDVDQPRLPLKPLSRFRTYVGLRHARSRLRELLAEQTFVRAIDVARKLDTRRDRLPVFAADLPPSTIRGPIASATSG